MKSKDLLHKILRLRKVLLKRDAYLPVQLRCNKITLGNRHAEWTICPDKINKSSVVYSFGIGTDISFDEQIIDKYGLTVFAFDPTPKSIQWIEKQKLPEQFKVAQYGLSNRNGTVLFEPPENQDFVSCTVVEAANASKNAFEVPVKRLAAIMKELGHRHIDILKMDIEGEEYPVIADILESNLDVKQILVEFHHRFDTIGIQKTLSAVDMLNRYAYQIFHISPSGEEYSFIRKSKK